MKQKFDRFGFFLGWLGIFVALSGIEPTLAAKPEPETESYSISARDLLKRQISQAQLVKVTGITLQQTPKGLEIVLQTSGEQQLVPLILPEGNNLVIEILDATLALPQSNEFREINPIEGIAEVSAVQLDESSIRLTIIGKTQAPTAEAIPSPEKLVLNVTLGDNTAPAKADEEIEVVATAPGEEDYFVPEASTGTRTDAPILDIPQSVQVIPRQILEDQQVTRLDRALRNASGVTFGGTDLGRSLQFNIRGFDGAPILRNGFRQFGADVVPETANLEQIEVLKGPASVLYGEIEPGGLINLVTKKPTSEPFYKIEGQFGNRTFISPSIDISGPLTADRNLLYRLNALYRTSEDIQDVDRNIERFYISPVLTWKIGDRTDLTLELEYFQEERPPSFGIPAIGNEIAEVPFDRISNEPDDFGEEEFFSVGYDFEHRFSDNGT